MTKTDAPLLTIRHKYNLRNSWFVSSFLCETRELRRNCHRLPILREFKSNEKEVNVKDDRDNNVLFFFLSLLISMNLCMNQFWVTLCVG